MDINRWYVYSLFLLFEVIGVSFFMEVYKKYIRKDNFKKWEAHLIGGILSLGGVFLLDVSHMMYPVLNSMFGASLWLDGFLYLVAFYILQLNIDMRLIKFLIKAMALQWIKRVTGLSLSELNKLKDEKQD